MYVGYVTEQIKSVYNGYETNRERFGRKDMIQFSNLNNITLQGALPILGLNFEGFDFLFALSLLAGLYHCRNVAHTYMEE